MFYQNHPKNITRVLSTLILILIAVWGCGKSNNAGLLPAGDVTGTELGTTTSTLTTTTSILATAAAGDTLWHVIDHGTVKRASLICLPSGYDANQTYPLMLALHGRGGNAEHFAKQHSNLRALASAKDFVLVFPEGAILVIDAEDHKGYRWNAFDNSSVGIDDVDFLVTLITQLMEESSIDAKNVFISGFSNGAAMTQRFAAQQPDLIQAAAAVCHSSGYIPSNGPSNVWEDRNDTNWVDLLDPITPVSILLINGGRDGVIPSDSTRINKDETRYYRSPEEQLNHWLKPSGNITIQPTWQDTSTVTTNIENFPTAFVEKRKYTVLNSEVWFVYSENLSHHWRDNIFNVGFNINSAVLNFFQQQSNSNQQ